MHVPTYASNAAEPAPTAVSHTFAAPPTRQLGVRALGHGLEGLERVRAEHLDEEVEATLVVESADLVLA